MALTLERDAPARASEVERQRFWVMATRARQHLCVTRELLDLVGDVEVEDRRALRARPVHEVRRQVRRLEEERGVLVLRPGERAREVVRIAVAEVEVDNPRAATTVPHRRGRPNPIPNITNISQYIFSKV